MQNETNTALKMHAIQFSLVLSLMQMQASYNAFSLILQPMKKNLSYSAPIKSKVQTKLNQKLIYIYIYKRYECFTHKI